MTQLDHLVVAGPDLAAAVDRFEAATGVRPEFGGAHRGLGTHNALVSFGSAYLEIIAADPAQPSPTGPRPFGIDAVTTTKLVTFAVHPDPGASIDQVVSTAREAGHDPGTVIEMHRIRPDGERLDWRLTLPDPELGGFVPFLIDWGDTVSPARTAPRGVDLVRFGLRLAAAEVVTDRLDALQFDLPTERTSSEGLWATVRGPRGDVRF
jgi:hypothetical protein